MREGDPTLTETIEGRARGGGALTPGDSRRYEVHGEHARGGLGRVLRARDRRLQRTVAIKELASSSPAARARFVREALITARLEHPGIVPVHDLGAFGDQRPYYVMKLLAGSSLRARIKACVDHTERLSLLPTVIAVAEAVAYAHDRGVIHRDIKPSNVMVGSFGETVVVDWGLAKLVDDDSWGEAWLREPVEMAPEVDDMVADTPGAHRTSGRSSEGLPTPTPTIDRVRAVDVTGVGEVLGTPAYMPPEQARGEDVSVRADVYALGALLYHTLCGVPPYEGSSSRDILEQVKHGPGIPVEEREPRVGPELAAIVGKAMARDAGDRYADAGELAAELRRYQTGQLVRAHHYSVAQRLRRWLRRRRRALLGTGIAVLAAAAIYGITRETAQLPSCTVDPAALAGVWDDEVRDRLGAAFRASSDPRATAAFDRLAPLLDARARAWVAMREDSCRDTHRRGVQPPEVFAARARCLDRRRTELAALTAELELAAGRGNTSRAVRAIQDLPGLEACADLDAMRAMVPPPGDPRARALLTRLEHELATAGAQNALGRYDVASDALRTLAERARTLGHAPLTASVLHDLGHALEGRGDPRAAREAYRSAAVAASKARDDGLAARSWLDVLQLEAVDLGQLDVAEALVPVARAAVDRTSETDLILRGMLHENVAVVHMERRRWREAGEEARQALTLYERTTGPASIRTAVVLNDLGTVAKRLGDHDEARDFYQRSLRIHEDELGAQHPRTAAILHNLGLLLKEMGDLPGARAMLERTLAAKRTQLGPDHPRVANSMGTLAEVELALGDAQAAAGRVSQSLAILEAADAPATTIAAHALVLAKAHLALGDASAALPLAERGVGQLDGERRVEARRILAKVLWRLGRRAAARAEASRARAETGSDEHRAAIDAWLADPA